MLDRSRKTLLVWAGGCLVLFVLLTLAVKADPRWVRALDDLGSDAAGWALDVTWLKQFLLVVEDLFNTVGMTVLTVVLAGTLLVKKHPRAAAVTVGVMLCTSLLTSLLKVLLSRDRPDWQEVMGLHDTMSFPSGHASATAAFCGILVTLALVFVRRRTMRRLAVTGLVLLWLLVAADRVLLGRHYPTDVMAGALLGLFVLLVALNWFDPRPRMIARPQPGTSAGERPSERKVAVVLNPIKVEDVGAFRHLVTTMAKESGWAEPSWHYTTVEDPGTGMARAALADGVDLVLVCGGDGTVREVCATLAGSGVPVGIIPAGTGNLLARNLAVPLYIRSAVDVGLNGVDRPIDLVSVTGDGLDEGYFMVMAGMGFDAAIMEGVNDQIKKRIGWVAYFLSGAKSLMFPAVKVEISVDDAPFTTHRARTVVVGNVGYLQAGMPLLPDAAIDDGLLDVVILHPKRFLSWLPLAMRVLSKSQRTDTTIDRLTGAKVVVRAERATPRQLDGDSVGAGKELTMECLPGQVTVRVPH